MTRHFVNGLANFVVEGNLVSFTLTDQRTDGQGKPLGSAQPVTDVLMRISDFRQLADYLGDASKEIERQLGRTAPTTNAGKPRPEANPKQASKQDLPQRGMRLTPGD